MITSFFKPNINSKKMVAMAQLMFDPNNNNNNIDNKNLKRRSTIEEVSQRFPSLVQKILNHVDDKTLINFKEAGRKNDLFLRNERFYWIRVIKRNNYLIGELQEVWNKVVRKTPVEMIKELAVSVHQFPHIMKKKYQNETLSPFEFIQKIGNHWHPLFVAATCGCTLCNHVMQRTDFNYRPQLLWRIYDTTISPKYISNHSEISIVYHD